MLTRLLFTVTLLFGLSATAHGEDIRSELDGCRSIQSLALRLQCYDKLVDGLDASGLSTVVERSSVPAPGSAPRPQVQPATQQTASAPAPRVEKTEVKPEELFGKSDSEVKAVVTRELEINTVDQIASEVTRVQVSPSKEYVVYLANGQVWKQKDKAGKWRIKVGERAIITRAALGSYLMKSDARKKSVRAERLR